MHCVRKYILVSCIDTASRFSLFPVLKNLIYDNVIVWKQRGEQAVRESGLDYMIVRAGTLVGARSCAATGVSVTQNDTTSGILSRASLAAIVRTIIEDETLPKKCTFECVTLPKQLKRPFSWHFSKQVKSDSLSPTRSGQNPNEFSSFRFRSRRILFCSALALVISVLLLMLCGGILA